MPIPKIIHQTFKTEKLPFITKWHISRFRKKNPDYIYEFYDDQRIEKFLSEEFDEETLKLYQRLNIGAAKADFFRYAILLKKGGVYLDIDSSIRGSLNDFIKPTDTAVISEEGNPTLYVQWALVYEPGHPFLKQTLELVCDNIRNNRYPHDVHKMTGPTVYTQGVNTCIANTPDVPYRLFGIDYNGHLRFKYPFSKLLYRKGEHWKKLQLTRPVLRPD
ncbi:glycosyltransferase family 32 protein [Pedobacter nutrimenti]|nr:glycosyltransferase [Pedobacter nutrimenti]